MGCKGTVNRGKNKGRRRILHWNSQVGPDPIKWAILTV